MSQKGFATLEVILMVMVIGILASIAVPRFTSVTTAANTAKIQSDLSTINTAIQVFYMEHGKYPKKSDDISVLEDYIQGAKTLEPPSGFAYIKTGTGDNDKPTATQISGDYKFVAVTNDSSETDDGTIEVQAALGDYTADQIYIPKKD